MVRIPYIKIPSVRVGSIGPTSNIGTGGAKPAPPTPITYLTQWKIVGNSEVHGVGNLTSWKVSGNSVVDNNTILSCGDLGQDGKYHVKISNGVTIFDIPLSEPLRKVNDVADTIEFPSSVEGKALVTRNLDSADLGKLTWSPTTTAVQDKYRMVSNKVDAIKLPASNDEMANILSSIYETKPVSGGMGPYTAQTGIAVSTGRVVSIYDENYNQSDSATAFKAHIDGVELIYELTTPTTELVDVSPFSVSPTDTYTSANVVPYSAFEHTENKEIWSCGEYNATDGKYHILVQPQGGSIADIALTEPLRKVNDVADTIEFPSDTDGKALVTRNIKSVIMSNITPLVFNTIQSDKYRFKIASDAKPVPNYNTKGNILCAKYRTITGAGAYHNETGIADYETNSIMVYDNDHCTTIEDFLAANTDTEVIYELVTPTTELVDAPQIQEADSYSMVISQGGKAVEWSSFETDSD